MKKLKFHGKGIVTGIDSIEVLKDEKSSSAVIVTGGQSMIKSGVVERITNMLKANGTKVYIHSGVSKNPDTSTVLEGLEKIKEAKPDLIIAVGGGSAIDAAKIMTLFYEFPNLNFENVLNEVIPSERTKVRFIAIPSTSGTGSEVTKVSVITFRERDLKLAIKSDCLVPDLAILDPILTMTMPKTIVAETGMDALTHAVECYINNDLDEFTESLAKGAIEGLIKYLPWSYSNGDIKSREKVHNYQCMAGCAFGNVGLGMVHGISHAFGGKYNLAHGLTNAIILPYALQYNSKDTVVKNKLKYLSRCVGVEDIIKKIEELKNELNIPKSIKDAGINEEKFNNDLELLVENSMLGATKANPIEITNKEMKEILIHVYNGINFEYEK